MSTRSVGIAFVLAAAACHKPPPEAPKELGDLGLFLFKHFEDEDPLEMAVGIANLREQVLATDLALEPKDRAVTMPVLEGDNLGGLSIPEGADANEQIPIALAGVSIHPLDDQMVLVVEPNQVCIESSTTKWAQREFLTDTACFEDQTCDELETVQEVRKESAAAQVWYDQYKNYRWFELEDEDGNVTRAIAGRSWIDQVFLADGGNNSWDQLFHLDIYIEDPADPESTLRWFSLWSSISVDLITDDLFSFEVVRGISDALVWGDEFISGDIVSCSNDRDLPKPPRE